MNDIENLPCCGPTTVVRLKELPHIYGFDFDLFSCGNCGRTWAYCFSSAGGAGAWEWVSESDAEQMISADGDELQQLMRIWAQRFS